MMFSSTSTENTVDVEEFYAWLWQNFESKGLVGVHEGTVLSEEAVELGIEADSWTVDSGVASGERDWVAGLNEIRAELYFASSEAALSVAKELEGLEIPASSSSTQSTKLRIQVGPVVEQKPQDWDADWKASFLNAGEGVTVPPFWRVVPPWYSPNKCTDRPAEQIPGEVQIQVNPGAGFGTGTHETTQLCLEAIGTWWREGRVGQSAEFQALDFGSGSGILSIAMALLGAKVDAVEIDPLAVDNAEENARLNRVETSIQFAPSLEVLERDKDCSGTPTYRCPEKHSGGLYQAVVANILRPVLLEFAPQLIERVVLPGGVLILSGLIERDLEPVLSVYRQLLDEKAKKAPQFSPQVSVQERVLSKGEWRAIVFKLVT